MMMWRFRGFDRAELLPLMQGAVLKEKLNVQSSILLMFEPAKKKKKTKESSSEEACLSSHGLNGCCKALTA